MQPRPSSLVHEISVYDNAYGYSADTPTGPSSITSDYDLRTPIIQAPPEPPIFPDSEGHERTTSPTRENFGNTMPGGEPTRPRQYLANPPILASSSTRDQPAASAQLETDDALEQLFREIPDFDWKVDLSKSKELLRSAPPEMRAKYLDVWARTVQKFAPSSGIPWSLLHEGISNSRRTDSESVTHMPTVDKPRDSSNISAFTTQLREESLLPGNQTKPSGTGHTVDAVKPEASGITGTEEHFMSAEPSRRETLVMKATANIAANLPYNNDGPVDSKRNDVPQSNKGDLNADVGPNVEDKPSPISADVPPSSSNMADDVEHNEAVEQDNKKLETFTPDELMQWLAYKLAIAPNADDSPSSGNELGPPSVASDNLEQDDNGNLSSICIDDLPCLYEDQPREEPGAEMIIKLLQATVKEIITSEVNNYDPDRCLRVDTISAWHKLGRGINLF